MQNYGGISRSFAEIIPLLPVDIFPEIAVKESDNYYLRENNIVENINKIKYPYQTFFPKVNFRGKHRLYEYINRCNPFSALKVNQKLAVDMLKSHQFDVFHPTYFDDYFLRYIKDTPWVLTIHDMIPELFGFQHWQIEQKKKLAPLASHIVAVSERTKQDIVNILNIPPEKISVIYHASSIHKYGIECMNDKIPNRYLLYVGDRKGIHKNFYYFIKEIASLLNADSSLYVVCTGVAFDRAEMRIFQQLDISSQFIQCNVSDAQLAWLYRNAIAYICPSLYEGFGIPILEAYANGCPTILSNSSCFPEIAGTGAIYFDPKQKDSLKRIVECVINMSKQDKLRLLRDSSERFLNFSWEKSARQLVEVYQKLL